MNTAEPSSICVLCGAPFSEHRPSTHDCPLPIGGYDAEGSFVEALHEEPVLTLGDALLSRLQKKANYYGMPLEVALDNAVNLWLDTGSKI